MHKLVKIKELYTNNFGVLDQPFTDSVLVKCLVQAVVASDFNPYYDYLKTMLNESGQVWGVINTETDIERRIEQVKGLIQSLRVYGYREDLVEPLRIVGSNIYGGIIVRETERLYLIDGNHRTSILYALGQNEVPALIIL